MELRNLNVLYFSESIQLPPGQMKIILVGESGVGKSCLIHVFEHGRYVDDICATTGAAFVTKQVEVDQNMVKLEVWDTAGQEVYSNLMTSYYRDASVCLICFNKDSLDEFKKWHDRVKAVTPDCAVVGVITKCDLYSDERMESMWENVRGLKDAGQVDFEEVIVTSARNMVGIEEVFLAAAKYAMQYEKNHAAKTIPLIPKTEKGCC